MMQEGLAVPTLNLDEVDPRCSMIRHVRTQEQTKIRTASVQNFAFGGVNTCLLFRRFEG
jgi:3-oxoacyl-[acyl-carrier-protein] synthase II